MNECSEYISLNLAIRAALGIYWHAPPFFVFSPTPISSASPDWLATQSFWRISVELPILETCWLWHELMARLDGEIMKLSVVGSE